MSLRLLPSMNTPTLDRVQRAASAVTCYVHYASGLDMDPAWITPDSGGGVVQHAYPQE